MQNRGRPAAEFNEREGTAGRPPYPQKYELIPDPNTKQFGKLEMLQENALDARKPLIKMV